MCESHQDRRERLTRLFAEASPHVSATARPAAFPEPWPDLVGQDVRLVTYDFVEDSEGRLLRIDETVEFEGRYGGCGTMPGDDDDDAAG